MHLRFFIIMISLFSMSVFSGNTMAIAAEETVAQENKTSARTPAQATGTGKGERKQTLSFEDELVEGATQKPELFYLFQKKNFNYKRLIKLRENFLPEMRKTSEDLQRPRSGN